VELAINNFKGEQAALTAAFLWAASSAVYGLLGQRIPPLQLNLLKGLIAILLICLTLFISSENQPQFNSITLVLFLLSGIIGIGLGDTAYFSALNNLGARRALLMETLAPPMTALLALILLGEQLSFGAWCGILITGIGVGWVITERTPGGVITNNNATQGIMWGMLAEIAQSIGVIISRFALVSSNINPLWSTLFRLIGGTIIVILLLLFQRKKPSNSRKITWSIKLLGVIFLAAFASTYLGIWLQQTSLKFAPAGIAQTLMATSPLFVIPIAAQMGEKISLRSILGVLIAISGISLLFTFR